MQRNVYLNRLISHINKPMIKVIYGVRKAGKTILLNQLQEYLKNHNVSPFQILYFDFEHLENKQYLDANNLQQYVLEKSKEINFKKLYLFFDEIDKMNGWGRMIQSFFQKIDCDIYIASSFFALENELSLFQKEEYLMLHIVPFTFKECFEFNQENNLLLNKEEIFDSYLKYGGIPQRFLSDEPSVIENMIFDSYYTILYKYILEKTNFIDVKLIDSLSSFFFNHIGEKYSSNSVYRELKKDKNSPTVATIIRYINFIKNALLIHSIPRYDIKEHAFISTNEVVYVSDLSYCHLFKTSNTPLNKEALYKNCIFLEMISRGFDVYAGKLNHYEVDFICVKDDQKIYIQVVDFLSTKEKINQKFKPLRKIDDNYPKYIISDDRHDFSNMGIIHKNIIDFLLDLSI